MAEPVVNRLVELVGKVKAGRCVRSHLPRAHSSHATSLSPPEYTAQVRAYGRLLEETSVVAQRHLRCGLLFTVDGGIRWADAEPKRTP
jgi:hypothetical protein